MSDTSPKLPEVPGAAPKVSPIPKSPNAEHAVQQPKPPQDPTWWRLGSIPFLVLVMVAAAADLAWPRANGWGLGAGIGSFLAINALLLLRKDFTRGEYWFLQGLAALNMLALFFTGNMLNWFLSLVLPFGIVMLPTQKTYTESATQYRSWWGYWVARRPKSEESGNRFAALRAALPLLICILVGLIFFVSFLCIFASGNPVVELVWNTLVDWWNKLVSLLQISWDIWVHALYWLTGILWFGIYCFSRPQALPAPPVADSESTSHSTTLLPYLPLCILIGINAAFAVATSTDIAFLWFGNVPEGISQTSYLHEGAISITWASTLAAGVLLLLFRRNGQARCSAPSRFFGYLLVAQTALLAISVYMRLYHQISDYGFTVRRIQAAEAMLLGLAGLVILLCYMSTNGTFRKYSKVFIGTIVLMLVAFTAYSPARLAGNLNMTFLSSHPHWNFSNKDFRPGCFDVSKNLAFAELVYNKENAEDNFGLSRFSYLSKDDLTDAALDVEKRATGASWLTINLATIEDIPAAERILGRPITLRLVEPAKE